MTAIARYVQAKAEYEAAQAFVAMFDVTGNKVADLVYYHSNDPKDGPTVQMPQAMRKYAEKEAKQRADNIGRAVLVLMQADLVAIAEEARVEYAQIAADAGITLP